MIKLTNVCKTYNHGKSFVVKDVNLNISAGEILVLLGSSGSGKTTTMKMINHLIKPSSGSIEINGQDIRELNPVTLRRNIGYVFQGIGLFPHLTAAENVSVVLRLLKKSKTERITRAHELLELVNLPPAQYAQRMISELSGGQRQRVGVARALANDPDLLLMDEPFGALDFINRNALQEEVLRLNKDLRKTIVFVTHDLQEAARLADRIAVMDAGKLEQIGTPSDIMKNPATEFVAELVNTHNDQTARHAQQFNTEDRA